MTNHAVHASRNALSPWLPSARSIAVSIAAAAFLTLTDAFELEALPLGKRFLYWVCLLGIAQFGSLSIQASLDRIQLSPTKLVLAGLLRTVLLSMPVTVAVWLVTAMALSQPLRAAPLPEFFLPVLLVVAAMVCLNLLVQRRPIETHGVDTGRDPPQGPQPAAILTRLPHKLRAARLHAVQAEDHYIRLYTSAGSDLVLLRFSDALAELRGLEGAQVHRSWWVARDAVESSHREDGKLFLLLRDGTKVPVSRTFTRALQASGWF
ncbi:MAG: LytTR family DNA-binding domain-containing protein [Rhizomicrobium sp.]